MLILIALFASLQLNVRSAHAQASVQGARKFDEFGDIQYSDLIARLDNFAIQLQQEQNTRGFIMVYRTRRDLPGLSNRFAMSSKNYMVMTRGVPAERVVTVDGGVANCLTQELWIVPIGATPKPISDAYDNSFVDTDSPRKFDEHSFGSPEDGITSDWSANNRDMAVYLDAFAAALQKEPQSKAYIIAYGQYYIERGVVDYTGRGSKNYRRVYLDSPGTAMKILSAERDYLIKTYRIAPSRIKLVNGGYRSTRLAELWIVPRGASAPIPTPNRFPRGRRK